MSSLIDTMNLGKYMPQISFKAPRCFAFVKESNAIEGIVRNPTREELDATEALIANRSMTVEALNSLQKVYAPGMHLRNKIGLDVRVGTYFPPPGSPKIEGDLWNIIGMANSRDFDAWEVHVAFELLHPYMDGNGRVGRALWAWKMINDGTDPFELPFLQQFYYQTLSQYSDCEDQLTSYQFKSWEPE